MSWTHALMDFALWCVATLWLCQFLARHPRTSLRNRRLPQPSAHCERQPSWDVHRPSLTRRQAE